jgi:hypothetical protein
MGGGSSPPSNTTSTVTNKSEPPAYVKPYAEALLTGGSQIASQPYQPYPGMTVAPLSPEHQAAMYMTGQRATLGSPVQQSAQGWATDTLNGMGFDNPYLSQAIRMAQEEAAPSIGYMGREGGSYGNTGVNQAWTNTMGDIASQMRYANYDAERSRQLQTAQLAPELAGLDYKDAQMLMGVGDAKRAYQQELIDRAVGEWDASMNWPYNQYDWMANILRGAGFGTYGQSSSTTTQPNPNAQSGLANMIGGGMVLGGLGNAIGMFG